MSKLKDPNSLDERLEVGKMSKDERSSLLNKFEAHGARVLTQAEIRRKRLAQQLIEADKKRMQDAEKRGKPAHSVSLASQEKIDPKDKKVSQYSLKTGPTWVTPGFFEKLSLHFRCVNADIKNLFAGKTSLKPRFYSDLRNRFTTELLNLRMSLFYFSRIENGGYSQFRYSFVEKNPLLYEIFERMKDLYNEEALTRINELISEPSPYRYMAMRYRLPFTILIKNFIVLFPYRNNCYEAIQIAKDIKERHDKVNETELNLYLENAQASIKYTFGKMYDKLFLAFLASHGANYQVNELEGIKELINWDPELDEVGRLADKEKKWLKILKTKPDGFSPQELEEADSELDAETSEEKQTDEQSVEDKKEIDTHIDRARQIIRKIDFDSTNLIDKKYRKIGGQEWMLKLNILMEFFGKEFSFILSGYKVQYDYFRQGQQKYDFRQILNDLYIEIDRHITEFHNYWEEVEQIKNIKDAIGTGGSIAERHELDLHIDREKNIAASIRKKIDTSLSKLDNHLQTISEHMGAIVTNADEKLQFDRLDGNKLFQNTKVEDAINILWGFVKIVKNEYIP